MGILDFSGEFIGFLVGDVHVHTYLYFFGFFSGFDGGEIAPVVCSWDGWKHEIFKSASVAI